MDSCTIVIPHVNTPYLVEGSINQIKKLTNNVDYEIWLVDQSDEKIHQDLVTKYKDDEKVKVIKLPKIDAGLPIDYAARNSTKEFLCSLDADAFPIHKNWLYATIKLIKEFNLSFVGNDTGLSNYPLYKEQGKFVQINNYFRVSRTSIAKELSEQVGFCRVQSRPRTGLTFKDNTWGLDHSDNGVLAQWYSDKHAFGDKLSLAINKIIGMTNEFGVYGMCLDDLVFHMVFGYHPDTIADAKKSLGDQFLKLEEKIRTEGLTEKNINKLIKSLKNHHPYESRTLSISGESHSLNPQHGIYLRLDELKAE